MIVIYIPFAKYIYIKKISIYNTSQSFLKKSDIHFWWLFIFRYIFVQTKKDKKEILTIYNNSK